MILNFLEDLRDALALAFILGFIACLYVAMQPPTPHERPTASVTRFAELAK